MPPTDPTDPTDPADWSSTAARLPPRTQVPRQVKRPAVLTVIAVVSIGFGYVGFILLPVTQLAPMILSVETLRGFNPNYIEPQLSPAERAGIWIFALVNMVLALTMLAGGIGVYKLREWGRRLLVWFALAAIVNVTVYAFVQLASVDRFARLLQQSQTQPIDTAAITRDRPGQIVIASLMFLMWPLILLTVLTRRHVSLYFLRRS